MEFLISGYLNYDRPKCGDKASGEQVSVYVAYFCLMITLVIVPGFMIHLLNTPLQEIQTKEFKDSYGSMYEGVKTDSKARLAYFPIFIFRRFLFLFIAFGLHRNSVY